MKKQAVITATDLCIGYRTHKGEKKVHEHLSFELYGCDNLYIGLLR